jgi:hypothetical protein
VELRDWVILAPVIVQAVYAALTYHRDRAATLQNDPQKQPRRPIVIIGTFMILTWAAVGFDYFNRSEISEARIINYGVDGPTQFHAIVTLNKWQDYKDYKGLLITRTSFADRDRMNDDWIAKSIPYTIDSQYLTMIAITHDQMRFATGAVDFIEYNFIVIPKDKRAEQIITLGDVAHLGGKILAVAGQGIPIPAPTDATKH